jgi:hypothetical protein|tara:strand:+ start:9859 stop:10200 length:342 start_codon:yes stop_codon:yes gene_type:complete
MSKLKAKYQSSKSAKVGDTCVCPTCNSGFVKTNYQQAFCKSKGKTVCKDKYWNTVTPEKRNNTTRISPASASYMASRTQREPQRQRPQAWEVFGVWHDDDWNEGSGGSGVTEC